MSQQIRLYFLWVALEMFFEKQKFFLQTSKMRFFCGVLFDGRNLHNTLSVLQIYSFFFARVSLHSREMSRKYMLFEKNNKLRRQIESQVTLPKCFFSFFESLKRFHDIYSKDINKMDFF
jgi:hypothetical protein